MHLLWQLYGLVPCIISEQFNEWAYVLHLSFHKSSEKDGEGIKFLVHGIADPGLNLNSIFVLSFKVLLDIVHNYGLGKISAQASKILEVDSFISYRSMLSVKPMHD